MRLLASSATSRLRDGTREIVLTNDCVMSVNELLTLHLGPDDVLLTLSVDFHDNRTSKDVEEAISRMEREIKERFPEIRRVFIEAQSIAGHRAAAARDPDAAPSPDAPSED